MIRLLAATQVAFHHACFHLGVVLPPWVEWILEVFPGVPIFFFISGFLISKSYEINSATLDYAKNRFLRIYPALVACTLLTIISVYAAGYFSDAQASIKRIAFLALGQISIFQFYNPDFMRGFGTGVLNGSLWTITVELQFYLLIPILYFLFRGKNIRIVNIRLIAVILLFMACNILFVLLKPAYEENVIFKLLKVSFVPWFYMFLIGIFFQRNFELFHRILHGRYLILLALYGIAVGTALNFRIPHTGNTMQPPFFILLAALVFSFAYSFPFVTGRVLRGNDISYGVYIYHMPVINMFVYLGIAVGALSIPLALGAALVASAASWFLVERPSLKLKNHTLKRTESI